MKINNEKINKNMTHNFFLILKPRTMEKMLSHEKHNIKKYNSTYKNKQICSINTKQTTI